MSRIIRPVCFLLCIPSGAVLVAKSYGLIEMHISVPWIVVPCCVALLLIWLRSRARHQELAADLLIGFAAGLVGTLSYDIVRVPFTVIGYRVFAPIYSYGVFTLDAEISTRFSDVAGWLYHFSNGITFGIMYALVFSRSHWLSAIVWALILETIMVVTPLGKIYSIRSNVPVLLIAYGAHVAYGLPLGLMIRDRDAVLSWLAKWPRLVWLALGMIAVAAAVGPLFSPELVARDKPARPAMFQVFNDSLIPNWIRVRREATVEVINSNSNSKAVTVLVRRSRVTGEPDEELQLSSGESRSLTFHQPGIYQVFVDRSGLVRSSFVIVEPLRDVP